MGDPGSWAYRRGGFDLNPTPRDPLDRDSTCPDCDSRAVHWETRDDGTPYLYCMTCGYAITIDELDTLLTFEELMEDDDGS